MLKVLGYLLQFKNEASKELKKVNKDLEQVQGTAKDVAKALKQFNGSITDSYDNLNKALSKFADNHDKQMGRIEKRRKKAQGTLAKLDSFLGENLGVSLGNATAVGVSAAVIATQITQASSLQKNLIDIQREAGFTVEEMNRIEASILNIGSSMSKTKKEITPVIATIADLGIKGTKDIDKITKSTLQFAQVAGMPGPVIAETFVKLNKTLGVSADSMDNYAALMMGAAQDTALSYEQVVASIDKIIPIARKVKDEYRETFVQEMITANAYLANSFPEQADLMMNAMNSFMDVSSDNFRQYTTFIVRSLKNEVSQAQLEQMARTGKATEVLKLFIKAAKNANPELRRTFETTLNGIEGVTTETFNALRMLETSGLDEMADNQKKKFQNAGKVMKEAYEKALPVADKFWAILDNIGTIIGSISMGILDTLGTALSYTILPAIEWVSGLAAEFKIVGQIVGWVVGIIATAVIAVAAWSFVIGPIMTAFAVIKFIALTIAAILTSTIGIFVLIAAAIGLVVYAVYTWWDEIVYGVGTALNFVGGIIMNYILPGFLAIWETITSFPSIIGNWIGGMFQGIASLATYIKDMTLGALSGVVNFVLGAAKSVVTGIINFLIDSVNAILEYVPTFGLGTVEIPRMSSTESVPQMAQGGMVMPKPGGSLVNVAEAGKPEIIADPDKIKDFTGTDDIVDAIWGAARYMVDELRSVKSNVQVIQQSNRPSIQPSTNTRDTTGFIF
jgi:phage-related minor tail protein